MGFQSSINQVLNIGAATQTVGNIKEENKQYVKENKEYLKENTDYLKANNLLTIEPPFTEQDYQNFHEVCRKINPEHQESAEIYRKAEANKSVAQERASRNIKKRPQKGVPTLNINDLRTVGGKK